MRMVVHHDGTLRRSIPPRAANHLTLIRSFLIDFTRRRPVFASPCAKFFWVVVALSAKQIETKNLGARAVFSFAFRSPQRLSMRARNLGFIDIFAKPRALASLGVARACASALAARNVVLACDATGAACASIHTSLSGTLLFSLCCSKWNAVRVDSRTH
jgi:hypothetical protein